jgi:DNA topoisomerase-2
VLTTDFSTEKTKEGDSHDYDYLMNMNIWSLTLDKIRDIEELLEKLQNEKEILESKTDKDLWKEDLDNFLKEFEVFNLSK